MHFTVYQRSDPFKSRKCERGDCPVCREDGKGPCDRQSVTYNIKCAECNDIYIGETSRSSYTRGKEHMKLLAKRKRDQPYGSTVKRNTTVKCRNLK